MNKYIKVTRESEKEVLTVLGKLGYKWSAGEEATGFSAFDITYSYTSYRHLSVMYIRISERGLSSTRCVESIPEGYDETTLEELKKMKYREVSDIKDLHTLENKDGTLIMNLSYGNNVCLIDITGEVILAIRKINQDVIDMLNSKGFNLIYKPVRTKEEIFEEIDKLAESPSENDDRYRLYFGYPRIDKFNVRKIDTSAISYPRLKGIKKEDAKRLCDELNRLEEVR